MAAPCTGAQNGPMPAAFRQPAAHPRFWPSFSPRFSLIVATLGRQAQLARLLDSLARQSRRDFEVIVVDQNRALDLAPLLAVGRWPFPILHLRATTVRGVSAARNVGWQHARGRIVAFPDDDCWYPPDWLTQVDALMRRTGANLVTGRPAAEDGRTINGRFAPDARPIDRKAAFICQIEWNMALHTALIRQLGGYDEAISLGGDTPWQGGEGFDLLLRAIAAGAVCHYDPALVAHHDEHPVARPGAAMIAKGRHYGRGLGFVLRKHRFGWRSIAWWSMRSLANLACAALMLRADRARYFGAQLLGRVEGWIGRPLGPIRP